MRPSHPAPGGFAAGHLARSLSGTRGVCCRAPAGFAAGYPGGFPIGQPGAFSRAPGGRDPGVRCAAAPGAGGRGGPQGFVAGGPRPRSCEVRGRSRRRRWRRRLPERPPGGVVGRPEVRPGAGVLRWRGSALEAGVWPRAWRLRCVLSGALLAGRWCGRAWGFFAGGARPWRPGCGRGCGSGPCAGGFRCGLPGGVVGRPVVRPGVGVLRWRGSALEAGVWSGEWVCPMRRRLPVWPARGAGGRWGGGAGGRP